MNCTLNTLDASAGKESFAERFTDLIACPVDLFERLRERPVSLANWLLPTLFIIALSAACQAVKVNQAVAIDALPQQRLNSLFALAVGNFAGLSWSATVLWLIARFATNARLPFWKSVEIVGLAGLILALSVLVNHLLATATGNVNARPALSLLVENFDPAQKSHVLLAVLNPLHVWHAAVLSLGISRLAKVPFADAAFWVFGYWIGLRVLLVIVGGGAAVI